MRKSPIAPNVNMDFCADLTDGFTGADITELCQRACKAAIREAISAEEERRRLAVDAGDGADAEMDADNFEDPVPVITRRHFEEAFAAARRSVNQHDLHKFEEFRKKFDPVYAKKAAGAETRVRINWPEDNSAQF